MNLAQLGWRNIQSFLLIWSVRRINFLHAMVVVTLATLVVIGKVSLRTGYPSEPTMPDLRRSTLLLCQEDRGEVESIDWNLSTWTPSTKATGDVLQAKLNEHKTKFRCINTTSTQLSNEVTELHEDKGESSGEDDSYDDDNYDDYEYGVWPELQLKFIQEAHSIMAIQLIGVQVLLPLLVLYFSSTSTHKLHHNPVFYFINYRMHVGVFLWPIQWMGIPHICVCPLLKRGTRWQVTVAILWTSHCLFVFSARNQAE